MPLQTPPPKKKSKDIPENQPYRPFLRRFREGISFPNFVERSILKVPDWKISAVPFALQNRALFDGENRRKDARKRGGRGVASRGGKKEKKDA